MQNGSVMGEETVYPNFVEYSCDEGFVLRGPSKIRCQTNGTWSKTSSFCEGQHAYYSCPSSSTVARQFNPFLALFLTLPHDMLIISR